MFAAIKREWAFLSYVIRLLRRVKSITPESTQTVADAFERWVMNTPSAPAIFFEDNEISWKAMDQGACRFARWARASGIGKGDVVALLMENRPEYIMAWFGLFKIGAVAALINTNQTSASLAHSLNISGARHLILDAELGANFLSAQHQLSAPMDVWTWGGPITGTQDLSAALEAESPAPIPRSFRDGLTAKDSALYIYTSGTTGLPKAAKISHLRMQMMMQAFSVATKATSKDIMYDVLPLYHSAGGVCALGAVFAVGGSVVLRRKFSASQFWDDCARYRPTLFQYIGELCRYLLNAPPHEKERAHALRLVIGNGLRPEIWQTFKDRFAIPHIVEFYGATEGNVALMNVDGKPGAVGRAPHYLRSRLPVFLVRFDLEKGEPVRDPQTGFCIECAPGEAGEAIGRIDKDEPRTNFEGYTKGTETEKKLLRGVFAKDDVFFRTGDLLRRDAQGYFYFVDRIGDTFRWKGENVATSEVAEALSVYPGIREANVYGVKLGEMDGRAGMAALIISPDCDLAALGTYLESHLPVYARPVILRILQHDMEITGTFKHRKVDLVKEGYDPASLADPLYWLNPENKRYEVLDVDTHQRLVGGAIKV